MGITKRFECNNCTDNAIKWLEKNKHLINDGGMSNEIIITVVRGNLISDKD